MAIHFEAVGLGSQGVACDARRSIAALDRRTWRCRGCTTSGPVASPRAKDESPRFHETGSATAGGAEAGGAAAGAAGGQHERLVQALGGR